MSKKKTQPSWPADAVERWPIGKLLAYPQNPMVHTDSQIERLAASLKEYGWTMPALVDEAGVLICGHARVRAAQTLGITEIPTMVARGWTEEQKRSYRIADNQLPRLAEFDADLLRLELTDLKLEGYDLSLTGFDDVQLVSFMTGLPTDLTPSESPVPEPPDNPVSRPGDIWMMGQHRVMCGDCRNPEHVANILGRRKVNVAFTSPPYAEQREYDASSGFEPIHPDKYVDWFAPVAENVAAHLADDGSWFVNIKPTADGLDTSLYVMDLVIAHVRKWGWHFSTEFCWERVGVPKSVTRRFKNQFEPVYQFARGDWKMRPDFVRHELENVPRPGGPGTGATSRKSRQGGNGPIFGAAKKRGFPTSEGSQGTDWQKGAPLGVPLEEIGAGLAYPGNRIPPLMQTHEALGHAAAFPVGLPAFFYRAFSDPGDCVLDPFMGSGSSLIAAEQNGRIGAGLELSPTYTDVTVERWMNLTGKQAVLLATKQTFERVAADRGVKQNAVDRAKKITARDVHRSLSEPRPPQRL